MHYNIRYLPETPYTEIVSSIEKAYAPFGGKVKVGSQSDGYFVSADDKKIKALTDACESVLGIECKPYTMGGGTYARHFPNAVSFGIESDKLIAPEWAGSIHGPEEAASVEWFLKALEMYISAVIELDAAL